MQFSAGKDQIKIIIQLQIGLEITLSSKLYAVFNFKKSLSCSNIQS